MKWAFHKTLWKISRKDVKLSQKVFCIFQLKIFQQYASVRKNVKKTKHNTVRVRNFETDPSCRNGPAVLPSPRTSCTASRSAPRPLRAPSLWGTSWRKVTGRRNKGKARAKQKEQTLSATCLRWCGSRCPSSESRERQDVWFHKWFGYKWVQCTGVTIRHWVSWLATVKKP